jgi:hypothetical protein
MLGGKFDNSGSTYIRLTCCDYKKEEGERVKEEGHVGGCTGALRW